MPKSQTDAVTLSSKGTGVKVGMGSWTPPEVTAMVQFLISLGEVPQSTRLQTLRSLIALCDKTHGKETS